MSLFVRFFICSTYLYKDAKSANHAGCHHNIVISLMETILGQSYLWDWHVTCQVLRLRIFQYAPHSLWHPMSLFLVTTITHMAFLLSVDIYYVIIPCHFHYDQCLMVDPMSLSFTATITHMVVLLSVDINYVIIPCQFHYHWRLIADQ